MLKFQTLIDAAAQWKAQFDDEPLELIWKVDFSGRLYLNGIWVCPYKSIEKVEVHEMGLDLWLDCGILTIIIAKSEIDGKRYIKCFERDIFDESRRQLYFPASDFQVPSYHGDFCQANKEFCASCDFALQCYPEWRPIGRKSVFQFEKDLSRNELSMDVINARRFAVAVRKAMDILQQEAACYHLTNEDYYQETLVSLGEMAVRLEAQPKQ